MAETTTTPPSVKVAASEIISPALSPSSIVVAQAQQIMAAKGFTTSSPQVAGYNPSGYGGWCSAGTNALVQSLFYNQRSVITKSPGNANNSVNAYYSSGFYDTAIPTTASNLKSVLGSSPPVGTVLVYDKGKFGHTMVLYGYDQNGNQLWGSDNFNDTPNANWLSRLPGGTPVNVEFPNKAGVDAIAASHPELLTQGNDNGGTYVQHFNINPESGNMVPNGVSYSAQPSDILRTEYLNGITQINSGLAAANSLISNDQLQEFEQTNAAGLGLTRVPNPNHVTIIQNLADINITSSIERLKDSTTFFEMLPGPDSAQAIVAPQEVEAAIQYRNSFKSGSPVTDYVNFFQELESKYFSQQEQDLLSTGGFSNDSILYWIEKYYQLPELSQYTDSREVISRQLQATSNYNALQLKFIQAQYQADLSSFKKCTSDSIGLLANSKYHQLDSTQPIFDIAQQLYGVPIPFTANMENKVGPTARNLAYNLSKHTTAFMRVNLQGIAYYDPHLGKNYEIDSSSPHGQNLVNDIAFFVTFAKRGEVAARVEKTKNAFTGPNRDKLFNFIKFISNIGNRCAYNLRDIYAPIDGYDRDFTVSPSSTDLNIDNINPEAIEAQKNIMMAYNDVNALTLSRLYYNTANLEKSGVLLNDTKVLSWDGTGVGVFQAAGVPTGPVSVGDNSDVRGDYSAEAGNVTPQTGKFKTEIQQFQRFYTTNAAVFNEISQRVKSQIGEEIPPGLLASIYGRESGAYQSPGVGLSTGQWTRRFAEGDLFPSGAAVDTNTFINDAVNSIIKEQGHLKGASANDISSQLLAAERWNGIGYRGKPGGNPYLYNGTSGYTSGQYTQAANGKDTHTYDPSKIDQNPGVALFLNSIAGTQGSTLPRLPQYTPLDNTSSATPVNVIPTATVVAPQSVDITYSQEQATQNKAGASLAIAYDENGNPITQGRAQQAQGIVNEANAREYSNRQRVVPMSFRIRVEDIDGQPKEIDVDYLLKKVVYNNIDRCRSLWSLATANGINLLNGGINSTFNPENDPSIQPGGSLVGSNAKIMEAMRSTDLKNLISSGNVQQILAGLGVGNGTTGFNQAFGVVSQMIGQNRITNQNLTQSLGTFIGLASSRLPGNIMQSITTSQAALDGAISQINGVIGTAIPSSGAMLEALNPLNLVEINISGIFPSAGLGSIADILKLGANLATSGPPTVFTAFGQAKALFAQLNAILCNFELPFVKWETVEKLLKVKWKEVDIKKAIAEELEKIGNRLKELFDIKKIYESLKQEIEDYFLNLYKQLFTCTGKNKNDKSGNFKQIKPTDPLGLL